jgi:hypothetical protein
MILHNWTRGEGKMNVAVSTYEEEDTSYEEP